MPMLNFRYVFPDHLIDLNRVAELSGINEDGAVLEIGAMTRQRELEFSRIIEKRAPIIRCALEHVGHRQTRNRGTFGGSLCHLDPSAEQVAMAALFGGEMHVRGPNGARRIRFDDFACGYMTTSLSPNELLTHVQLPLWPTGHGWSWYEYARRHGDFCIAGAGVLMMLGEGGAVERVSIVISGLGAVPVRLTEAEAMMKGEVPGDALFQAAATLAGKLDAMEDAYVTAEYRRHLAKSLCNRALREATARARNGQSIDA